MLPLRTTTTARARVGCLAILALAGPSATGRSDPQDTPPMTAPTHAHTNRLIDETSPYLLQHAHNPVDWYPWGPEALERARREQKPIFLSIGYSACHWCHVMERESFESEDTAAIMNEHFVNVKVDREERPDLDEIYMQYVQATTGSGGWPMSVFLTPELQPFFGGTYFPPRSLYGRAGFPDVLRSVASAWETNREQITQHGARFAEQLRQQAARDTSAAVDPAVLDASLTQLLKVFDEQWGGFGGAPKFPHTGDVRIMLRHWLRTGDSRALECVTTTLDRMRQGGIYDHLQGGFARYSTDEKWLIPHFEKMLYDNALLVPAYLEAHVATGNADYATVARECLDWTLLEMVTPEGGFASTIDADSEGVEGEFYVWRPEELEAVLGNKVGAWAAAWYGVTQAGNFEHGKSALWRHDPPAEVARELGVPLDELTAAMEDARARLLANRAERVPPGKDDKVLASWNGLMISAMAQGAQVLGDARYLEAARRAARYVLEEMRQEDGRLYATARGGHAHLNAYLDDYAFLIQGCLDLYETDFDPGWLERALELNAILEQNFADEENGGYFTTGDNHEQLIARVKSPHDGALPSGAGVQALNLLRLAELTGKGPLAQRAERTILSMGAMVNRYPPGFSQLLQAVDYLAAGPREVVIAGEPDHPTVRAMLREVRGTFRPQRVVALAHAGADADLVPLLSDRDAGEGGARAYVCRNYACKLPVDDVEGLREQLAE